MDARRRQEKAQIKTIPLARKEDRRRTDTTRVLLLSGLPHFRVSSSLLSQRTLSLEARISPTKYANRSVST